MSALRNFFDKEENIQLMSAAVGGISLLCSVLDVRGPYSLDPAWIAVLLCGAPIVQGAIVGLVRHRDIKAGLLVTLALVAAVWIDEVFAAGEVAFIMSLGEMLEARTVRKAREGIEKLVNLSPRTARVLRNGAETVIPAEAVAVGDILRVLPGETIAVDGVITAGQTAVDQSLVTGESLPVDKDVNDAVYSGTVNQLGAFDMRASKVGGDSSLQRMIRLVESAQASKTPIVRIMDRWATWIVVAALITAVLTWLATGDVIRAVTILVVFCPCALVLATPTAIMAGIGNATRFGVLVASGDALERLAKITRVAFDKTGTLTHGKPEVIAVRAFAPGMTDDDLLTLAATIEQRSEHPLGKAVLRYAAGRGINPQPVEQSTAIPGRGVMVHSNGAPAYGGTLQLMRDKGMEPDAAVAQAVAQYAERGSTVIYIAVNNAVAGIVALADTLRPDAGQTVAHLHNLGVQTMLLTGDNANAANAIASSVGIRQVRAELLPEDKVAAIRAQMRADGGDRVCMIGDGINDAPALKAAYVGLAMGGVGSDIAVDAADAVLVRDDIKRLPQLIMLARKTATTIKVNIFMAMSLNFIAVVLAATGILGPVLGALAHNAGAFLTVLNSVRLLRWQYR